MSARGRLARTHRAGPDRTRKPRPVPPSTKIRPGGSALLLALLFIVALGWRLAFQARLAASPLSGSLRGDERTYWDWASYLLAHGFRGTNSFFLGPLYPYFLALARLVFSSQPVAILGLQALMGALSVVLLANSARRFARPAVAVGIGLALTFYEMSVLFDSLILMESLLFLLECVLISLWLSTMSKPPSSRKSFVMGVINGAIASARGTGLLLLLPTLALTLRGADSNRNSQLKRAVSTLAGFAVFAAACLAWNWSRSREIIPFTYNFGFNLYVGNHPSATGGFDSITGDLGFESTPQSRPDGGVELDGREFLRVARGLDLTPGQSSRYWASMALDYMRANPVRTLQLAGMKLLLLFNRRETPQLENVELFRREAGPLGIPVVGTFLFIGVFGIVGLFFTRVEPAVGQLLRWYVGLSIAGLLPFFVTDRYRYHLVPPLALLAALGLEEVLRRAAGPGTKSLFPMAATAACAFALVALPLGGPSRMMDNWDVHRELGTRWLDQGRADRAADEFRQAIDLEAGIRRESGPEALAGERLARLHFNYAAALHKLGRKSEEVRWLEAAASEDTSSARYARTLADEYLLAGNRRSADSLLERLGALIGGESQALISRGWEAARAGRMAEAEDYFRGAVAADHHQFGAWGALIRIQVQQHRWVSADSTLAQAKLAGLPLPSYDVHSAMIGVESGNLERARSALAAIPPGVLDGDRQLASIAAAIQRRLERPPGR